ncbi:hypothetical protein [Hoeflea poritis]|uniref:Uncharacterized protein n=1 Tax=Hoeflea poritis TaxID=2993659 RepID=A0ABT4VMT9_9HYPH|nr:hypothetical protein [Hoeflea poritis]MDA4845980.1 hypothetical protein [Hoeflea poritis]
MTNTGFDMIMSTAAKAVEQDPDEQPLVNRAMEDLLAYASDESERALLIEMWIRIGAEYLAREVGRTNTRRALKELSRFIRDAQPSNPWKP